MGERTPPATATPLGRVAYRLNDIADELYRKGLDDTAAKVWGCIDDIVTIGQGGDDG